MAWSVLAANGQPNSDSRDVCTPPLVCNARTKGCEACVPGYNEQIRTADPRFGSNIAEFDTSVSVEVVGGEPTNRFPEVVMLQNAGQTDACSGVLIAPTFVLTARHCWLDSRVGEKGTSALFGHDKSSPVDSIKIAKRVHAEASALDLMLLRLERPAKTSPVAIATADQIDSNVALKVVGFGKDDGGKSGIKRQANVVIATHDCTGRDSIQPANYSRKVSDQEFYRCEPGQQMVASGRRRSRQALHADTCGGDSGGPAYVVAPASAKPEAVFNRAFDKENKYQLAGITSAPVESGFLAASCGNGGKYVRLSGEALQWINRCTAADLEETGAGGCTP